MIFLLALSNIKFFRSIVWVISLATFQLFLTSLSEANDFTPYKSRVPFEAPQYVPPPPPPPKVILTNNNDGTITDNHGLMWTQKDSYADLGQCLNWYESEEYVKNLKTGGYSDWRMPTVIELYGIYDDTIENVLAWDHDSNNPLHLSKQFSKGSAYWYWTGERPETDLTDCCAYTYYFVKGFSNIRRLSSCANGGVRAVRKVD